VLLFGIAIFAVLAAIGGTYFGLRGGSGKGASEQVSGSPVTTASPPTGSTTPASTTTVAPATIPTTASPPTTARSFAATSKPIAVAGGTFVVIGGEVSLTHVVAPGDTLFAISQWYKLMGGYAMLYKWNHSVIGTNPNLIFPGEVLTITVPGADIPRISPMWLAEAKAQAKARG
jgi:nucleoid-associated protein YgaU